MSSLKTCSKCHRELLVEEFPERPDSPDGHRNHCKDCRKKYGESYRDKNSTRLDLYDAERYKNNRKYIMRRVAIHRKKNIDKIRAYDRKRGCKYPDGSYRKGHNEWVKKTPGAASAHQAVYRAILSGVLKKGPCRVCGSKRSLAHHDDYSKPFDVIRLCHVHHRTRHKKLRESNKCPSSIARKKITNV
jgi:hypothetical protein